MLNFHFIFNLKAFFSALILTFFTATLCQAHEEGNNISDSILATSKNSSVIKAAHFKMKADQEVKAKAISSLLPNINVRLSDSQIENKLSVNDFRGNISLSQELFKGGNSIMRLRQADYLYKLAYIDFKAKEQEVLLNAVNAHNDVVRMRALNELYKSNVSVVKKHLDAAQKRFKFGEITKIEVAQAQFKLAEAEAQAVKAYNNLENIVVAYNRVTGINADHVYDHLNNFDISKYKKLLPESLEEVLELSKRSGTSLLSAFYRYKAQQNALGAELALLFPSVKVSAYGALSGNSSGNLDLSMSIDIPIFRQGFEHASIREAKFNVHRLRHEFFNTTRANTEAVMTAWNAIENSTTILRTAKEGVRSATIVVDAIKEEFDLNLRSYLNVLDAENDLTKSKVVEIDARAEYVSACYKLLLTIGNIIVAE